MWQCRPSTFHVTVSFLVLLLLHHHHHVVVGVHAAAPAVSHCRLSLTLSSPVGPDAILTVPFASSALEIDVSAERSATMAAVVSVVCGAGNDMQGGVDVTQALPDDLYLTATSTRGIDDVLGALPSVPYVGFRLVFGTGALLVSLMSKSRAQVVDSGILVLDIMPGGSAPHASAQSLIDMYGVTGTGVPSGNASRHAAAISNDNRCPPSWTRRLNVGWVGDTSTFDGLKTWGFSHFRRMLDPAWQAATGCPSTHISWLDSLAHHPNTPNVDVLHAGWETDPTPPEGWPSYFVRDTTVARELASIGVPLTRYHLKCPWRTYSTPDECMAAIVAAVRSASSWADLVSKDHALGVVLLPIARYFVGLDAVIMTYSSDLSENDALAYLDVAALVVPHATRLVYMGRGEVVDAAKVPYLQRVSTVTVSPSVALALRSDMRPFRSVVVSPAINTTLFRPFDAGAVQTLLTTEQVEALPPAVLRLRQAMYAAAATSPGHPRLPFVVGMIGRVVGGKAPGMYIKMVAHLLQQARRRGGVQRPFVFYIAGSVSPLFRAALDHVLVERGVDPQSAVTYLGFVPQLTLPSLYALTSVVVNPSVMVWETFNLVAAEVMASEVPVVAFCVSGMQDYCKHGHNVLVPQSYTAAGLAAQVEALAEDENRRVQLGRTGRQLVEQWFSTAANTVRMCGALSGHLK